jgi:hypothetical protein
VTDVLLVSLFGLPSIWSALPQAIAPNPHANLLNVYIQIANKMGFEQQQKILARNSDFSLERH